MRTWKVRLIMTVLVCLVGLSSNEVFGAVQSTSGGVMEIAAPASVALGALESNTIIQAFDEQQNYVLLSDLSVDITSAGTYSLPGHLTSGVISAGTTVDSHLLHFDTVGTGSASASGSVTFDQDILGIIVVDSQLNSSDGILGASGTIYPTGVSDRDLDLIPEDIITLEANMRTLTISNFTADVKLDQVRVITTPEPATLGLLVIGGLALLRRKR